ncbi:MAG: dockerin type I repeat-containing protein [Spirochaetes bacterium]|nr:dockerin type I repeat-containing protein [Spirochaetota bacterium]
MIIRIFMKSLLTPLFLFFICACESNFDNPETVEEKEQSENNDEKTPETTENKNPIMYGDVNSDSLINAVDALYVGNYIAETPLSPFSIEAADVDGDGQITSNDSDLISQYYIGTITSFPVEDKR